MLHVVILVWRGMPGNDGQCLPYVFQAQLTSTIAACWATETARWQYLWKMKSECHPSWEGRSTRQGPSRWLCAKSVSGQEIIQGNCMHLLLCFWIVMHFYHTQKNVICFKTWSVNVIWYLFSFLVSLLDPSQTQVSVSMIQSAMSSFSWTGMRLLF